MRLHCIGLCGTTVTNRAMFQDGHRRGGVQEKRGSTNLIRCLEI